MRNRIAALLCALVLLAGVPLALSAQITSTTSLSTGGLFVTEVDNVFSYDNVTSFSNFSGDSLSAFDFLSSSQLSLGYGQKVGGLFVAGVLQTNLFGYGASANNNYSTTNILNGDYSVATTRQSHDSSPSSSAATDNEFNVLLGFGTMGIRLGVSENYDMDTKLYNNNPSLNLGSTNWTSLTDGSTSTGSNSTAYNASGTTLTTTAITPSVSGASYWRPAVAFGMKLKAGDLVLTPMLSAYATLRTNVVNSSFVTYSTIEGSGLPTYQSVNNVLSYTDVDYAYKNYRTSLDGKIGSDVEVGALTFGLYYDFYTNLYSNSYIGTDGTTATTVAGAAATYSQTSYSATASTTRVQAARAYQADPRTYFSHSIDAKIQYTASIGDKVKASMAFQPNVSFDNTVSSSSGKSVITTTYTDSVDPTNSYTQVETKSYTGDNYSSSNFYVSPIFSGALSCPVIDNVLTISAGTSVNLARIASTTYTSTKAGYSSDQIVRTMADGTVDSAFSSYSTTLGNTYSESSSTNFSVNNVSLTYGVDLNWKLSNTIALDLMVGTSGLGIQLAIKK